MTKAPMAWVSVKRKRVGGCQDQVFFPQLKGQRTSNGRSTEHLLQVDRHALGGNELCRTRGNGHLNERRDHRQVKYVR